MKTKTAIIILALLLAGCATSPPPQKVEYIVVPQTVGSSDPVQDYIAQRIHDDQLRMRIEDDDFDTMMGMRGMPMYP